jgi:hypothetical protein
MSMVLVHCEKESLAACGNENDDDDNYNGNRARFVRKCKHLAPKVSYALPTREPLRHICAHKVRRFGWGCRQSTRRLRHSILGEKYEIALKIQRERKGKRSKRLSLGRIAYSLGSLSRRSSSSAGYGGRASSSTPSLPLAY